VRDDGDGDSGGCGVVSVVSGDSGVVLVGKWCDDMSVVSSDSGVCGVCGDCSE
jgi:hypothetical protein